MNHLNRRGFMTSVAATALLASGRPAFAATPATAGTRLRVQYRDVAIKGRMKKVFGILQPDGKHGLVLGPRDRLRVDLANAISDPTVVHWHGQEPPASQDGVAELSQYPIPPNTTQYYDFEPRPGTHWMHSHLGLQEQDLMAAPLIVRTADDERADVQEVVIMLHDFSFQESEAILTGLGAVSGPTGHAVHGSMPSMANMPGMSNMPGMAGMEGTPAAPAMPGMAMPGMAAAPAAPSMSDMKMDLNDVDFDAYLANDRTLDDPEIVRVEGGGRVRLRIINAAGATNFFIDLGALTGRAIAVDGNAIQPLPGQRFPLAIAQRIDIVLELPRGEGAWTVLAQREGEKELTGIVLATARGTVSRVADMAATAAGPLSDHEFESKLVPLSPLALRRPDRRVEVKLSGTMNPYAWSMSAHASGENLPIEVRYGERVEVIFRNGTMMPHPMHLHGHHFQVTGFEKDGKKNVIRGAIRDTVLVPPAEIVTMEFDAVNPGRWAFHCHTLYHRATGMMGEIRYVA